METKAINYDFHCCYCESIDKIKDCVDCTTNPDMVAKIIKSKAEMIKKARYKWLHRDAVIKPCSDLNSLWDCFAIVDLEAGMTLTFNYNVGNMTYCDTKTLIAGSH